MSDWNAKTQLKFSEQEAKILASNAYAELKKLVYPHVVQNVQSGKKLEDTMPTGYAQAAIICADIVDSSNIRHQGFHSAVEVFQSKLYDIMCERYDPQTLTSNGYRIKDVGDGAFYSIGFPFKTPDDRNPCELAINLSIKAIQTFHEEMKRLNYPFPITFGIGIASGRVEGFFPSNGLKLYDLRGAAIVLATRYQEFRKTIRSKYASSGESQPKKSSSGSMVIINEVIFNHISTEYRRRFATFDLNEHNVVVRNDLNAKYVYWLEIPVEDEELKHVA